MTAPALEFRGVGKSFSGVTVLEGISFGLGAGRTLGLVGENGAGKSTLMNILGGNLAPDTGTMLLAGENYAPKHPTDAARARVAFIHQELNLFTNLSISENIFITSLPRTGGLINRALLRRDAGALLERVGLRVSPDTHVEDLSTGERQLVEIARALSLDARLIIFDEPTTSLSARETATLFALIRELRQKGVALIYISHNLEHVLQLCDDLVVLRDGRLVAEGPRERFTPATLITAMVGRKLEQLYPSRRGQPTADPILEVNGLSQPFVARNITFTLHRGEVLGISGLMGAGRSELARMLFGLDPHSAGSIAVSGRNVGGAEPRTRIQQGVAFLTEDRRQEGLCLEASIADNLALVSLRSRAESPLRLINFQRSRDALGAIREAVRLNASARETQPVKTLSGGNQQKVVLGKWLLARPSVLILDEPTRGVDVGAKFELHQLILDRADAGCGVLLISSEIEELVGLCDRILVMSQGEIRGAFRRSEFDRERLLTAALPQETAP